VTQEDSICDKKDFVFFCYLDIEVYRDIGYMTACSTADFK
jgi:hypothetical protein